jgi:hypothetical protein
MLMLKKYISLTYIFLKYKHYSAQCKTARAFSVWNKYNHDLTKPLQNPLNYKIYYEYNIIYKYNI